MRINDTVTFVEDGFDEDIEFGDEISDDDEDDVDNVSLCVLFEILYMFYLLLLHYNLFLFSNYLNFIYSSTIYLSNNFYSFFFVISN